MAITILVIGLAGFIALVAVHVRAIMRSRFPGLRAIEALAINVPLFLLLLQMIANLIILGLAIKVVVGAVKGGQQRQGTPGQDPAGQDPAGQD